MDYKKKKNGEEMILIHWKGFPSENESWEPVSDFEEEVLENLAAFRKDWASKHSPMVILKYLLFWISSEISGKNHSII